MSTPAITVFTKRSVEDDPAGSLLSKRITLVDGQVVSDGGAMPHGDRQCEGGAGCYSGRLCPCHRHVG